jgi:acyl-CoA thioesterase-1
MRMDMKNLKLIQVVMIMIASLAGANAAETTKIKVACIGDSITFGHGIPDRGNNSYPAQLGKILGSGWDVANFGVSGHTLLKKGDHPYVNSGQYQAALAFLPDVVIIKLGTNDTKPHNWWHKKDYIDDYVRLINSFLQLESKPVVWICHPVPVFPERWGIKDSIVREEILPCIQYIAQTADVPIIDLYTPLKSHPEFFPDKVHPNAAGATEMATIIAALLSEYRDHAPPLPETAAGPSTN